MADKYYVYEAGGWMGRPRYLRIDEQGMHWMETSVSNATPLTYKRAHAIARSNNQSALQSGYPQKWGTCLTNSVWH